MNIAWWHRFPAPTGRDRSAHSQPRRARDARMERMAPTVEGRPVRAAQAGGNDPPHASVTGLAHGPGTATSAPMASNSANSSGLLPGPHTTELGLVGSPRRSQ